MKYHAIMSTAAALGVALSLTLPADAGERDGRGGHGIGAGQTGVRGHFSGSRSAYAARHGQFGSGRTFVGRSVSVPRGGLFPDYSDHSNRAGYDHGSWPGGIFFPLAAIAAGLGYPYYGSDGYGAARNPSYNQTGGYTLVPVAAEYAYGNYCATDVKTCLLYGPAATGVNCSCRVPGGRAYGSVIQ